jgi:hypothetical protein
MDAGPDINKPNIQKGFYEEFISEKNMLAGRLVSDASRRSQGVLNIFIN